MTTSQQTGHRDAVGPPTGPDRAGRHDGHGHDPDPDGGGVAALGDPPLHGAPRDVAAGGPSFDGPRVEAAVRELLLAIGEDPDREGLRDTPGRVARSYRELFAGLWTDPSEVLARTFSEEHDELVLVRDIPVFSMCEHHLLPFHGVAHVAYLPGSDGRVTGLSKLARLVDLYSRRPQVQERLTRQVADAMHRRLAARGVLVVVDAEHQCMSARGVRTPGARTTTSAVRGVLKSSPSTRAEALGLIRSG